MRFKLFVNFYPSIILLYSDSQPNLTVAPCLRAYFGGGVLTGSCTCYIKVIQLEFEGCVLAKCIIMSLQPRPEKLFSQLCETVLCHKVYHNSHTFDWSKIFKNTTWLNAVLSQGMYPVLIGYHLEKLSASNIWRNEPPYLLAISLAKPQNFEEDKSHRGLFLDSLQSEHYSLEDLEVRFSHFRLSVAGVLQDLQDLADPELLIKGHNTKVVYWTGTSTCIYNATAEICRIDIIIRHTNPSGECYFWIFSKTGTHREARQRYKAPLPSHWAHEWGVIQKERLWKPRVHQRFLDFMRQVTEFTFFKGIYSSFQTTH